MKKNTFMELSHLYRENGWYIAILYNRCCGYSKELYFDGYTKKEVLHELKHKHGITISRKKEHLI